VQTSHCSLEPASGFGSAGDGEGDFAEFAQAVSVTVILGLLRVAGGSPEQSSQSEDTNEHQSHESLGVISRVRQPAPPALVPQDGEALRLLHCDMSDQAIARPVTN
jgi:hypothetical protein